MILEVKVSTKSFENAVVGFEGNLLKIRCTAAPEKGKANESVIALVAEYYKVPKSSVKILRGQKSTKKWVEINDKI